MTPKDLKKLIKTCRDLGVKSYKGPDFEFTLTDSEPVKAKNKSGSIQDPVASEFESDTLSEQELLMWSVGAGGIPFSAEGDQS